MNTKSFNQFKADALVDAIKSIGNGDVVKGRHIVLQLGARLHYARAKHPTYTPKGTTAFDVILSEWKEYCNEVERHNRPRSKDEAYDVMATLTRFILDEDTLNGSEKHS